MLLTVSLTAQTEVDFLNAFGKGEADRIGTFLGDKVNFCVNDEQTMLSKPAAIKKIKKFLEEKEIKRFKMIHKGKSSDKKSSYRVARVVTKDGRYRVFAYSEGPGGGANRVTEIRIDKM